MDANVLKKISMWNNANLEASLRNELNNLSEEELEDAFYVDLAFGTGGLRGVMGVGTNRMNIYIIRKCTYGFGQYLLEKNPNVKNPSVTISYDCRHHSRDFAENAASVLATMGIKVYLFEELRSTPELSFAVRHLKSVGGIMVTASHNPPKYNGYKVYDEKGCQLIPELADIVIAKIDAIEDIFDISAKDFNELVKEGMIELIGEEIDKEYLKHVLTVQVQNVKSSDLSIVFTPLHGTASVKLADVLSDLGYKVTPVQEQMIPDGNFSTLKSPNPEDSRAFEYAIELGKKVGADILIATDPDADRMGIAIWHNDEYVLLTGNQTGAILLDYLGKFRKHGPKANVYNTIVTSNFAKAICDKYNLTLVQTLTGFKFIGEQAALIENTDEEFFFGYEESYGYVIKDFVRDKDSYQATVLLAEVAAYYKEQGKNLVEVLEDLYEEFGFYVEGVQNFYMEGKSGSEKINRIMETFQQNHLEEVCGKKIVRIEDYKLSKAFENGVESELTLPKSFVLKYIFEDGGWFVLRPSGTEPKLKIYIAIVEKTKATADKFISELQAKLEKMVEEVE